MLWGFMVLRGHRLGLQRERQRGMAAICCRDSRLCLANQAWLCMHACVSVSGANSVTLRVCSHCCIIPSVKEHRGKKRDQKACNCNGNWLLHMGQPPLALACPLSLSFSCSLSLNIFRNVTENYTSCPSTHFMSCHHNLFSLFTLSLASVCLPLCLWSVIFCLPLYQTVWCFKKKKQLDLKVKTCCSSYCTVSCQ